MTVQKKRWAVMWRSLPGSVTSLKRVHSGSTTFLGWLYWKPVRICPGVLADVISQGENDLYVVKDEKGKDHYIPAVKEFIAGVDLDKGEIRISLIEGLWES